MKLSDYIFIIPVITACLGWVVGILSTYFVTGWLERRRAFRALSSEVEAVRSEFSEFAEFQDIHYRSVESLKPFVFAAIPFLSKEKQCDAREAWATYKNLDTEKFLNPGIMPGLEKFYGEPGTTKQEAVDMMLSKLQHSVSSYFPWQ